MCIVFGFSAWGRRVANSGCRHSSFARRMHLLFDIAKGSKRTTRIYVDSHKSLWDTHKYKPLTSASRHDDYCLFCLAHIVSIGITARNIANRTKWMSKQGLEKDHCTQHTGSPCDQVEKHQKEKTSYKLKSTCGLQCCTPRHYTTAWEGLY